jgi:putative glutamine amidotransferase
MKKYALYMLIVILISISYSNGQYIQAQTNQEKTTIVLVHPYLEDIESIIYFVENNLIEIPNLELIGVFYTKAIHDYDKIMTLLKNEKYSYIHLKLIDGDLNEAKLFKNNALSKKFYALFKGSDGILFFGGYDIPPSIYGQKTNFVTNIMDPYRYYFELSFLFHLLGGNQNNSFQPYLDEKPNYVIHGYCLGMQTMNVSTGGSLYQNIPTDIYGLKSVEDVLNLERDEQHYQYYYSLTAEDEFRINFHRIYFVPAELFVKELKCDTATHPFVRSNHHQSVMNLGKGFIIAATSMDKKVIEAISHKQYKNVLGLQFHPEDNRLYKINEKKYKFTPSDTLSISYYDFLKINNSLQFHKAYWKYFSKLFSKIK